MSIISLSILLAASLLLIPALVFLVECAASLVFRPPKPLSRSAESSAVVLIPAHDEAEGIVATVEGVRKHLGTEDRVIVIADNCTDDTERLAIDAGAEVIARNDPARRGKGFALSFGTDHLESSPPDVVVVVDADCGLVPGSLDALVALASTSGRPVQADYTFAPAEGSPLSMISAFALVVRNRVRPRGLRRLGMPCHLTGTGMAFPWPALRAAPALGAHLVEDLAMGIELALLGYEPLLCSEAGVRSELPSDRRAAVTQRRRWEHGQMATLVRYGPRLVGAGIRRGRPSLIALGLDLIVPPLALLVALLLVVLGLGAVVAALGGHATGAWVAGAGLGLVTVGVAAAWIRYGREVIPFRYLLLTPLYLLWKIPLYAAFLVGRRERRWQRTER